MTSSSLPAAAPAVLVTGGGVRLGAEICRTFARAGWRVLCQYRHSAGSRARCAGSWGPGHDAIAIEGDLASETGRRALMAQAAAVAGPISCLINNASAFEPDSGADFDAELARAQLEINLIAPLSLARELCSGLPAAAQLDASVIHILDQKVFNLNPDYFSHTVTKLALERAVELQAQALAPRARLRRGPGSDVPERPADAGELRPRQPRQPAEAGHRSGRRRARLPVPGTDAIHHRQHALCGQRPTPGAAGAT